MNNQENTTRVSVDIAGTEFVFETGKLAKQAGGSVVVSAGETYVLATATAGNERDVGFLPLTVDVEERMYAAGKIPGGFFKREGRPSEKATLTARMIDRPLRPLFPDGWKYETQLVATPMCVDHENSYDILAMNGASAALALSDIPFPTTVGAVRIGLLDGKFIVNPDEESIPESKLDLIVAGTDEAILMVEAESSGVSEAEILDALDIAHGEIKKICAAQVELASKAGKPKIEVEEPKVDEKLFKEIEKSHGSDIDEASAIKDKLERKKRTDEVEESVMEKYEGEESDAEQVKAIKMAFSKLERDIIRRRIAIDKKRPDGRDADEIRNVSCEIGIAPRTHGSAIFTRGETQAFTVATLGTSREEQRIDTLGIDTTKRYMHHYNFPPYSVGEAGFMRGPKRRDIGHGALAERALLPEIPSSEDFPYTIRVVSEILESNGSSSMASVCGSTLSLMDAGVPIKSPVAGIAMGLIKEGDDFIVLSDIAGVEDHLGDMDFKIAGTREGINALQMDIKISGVTFDILKTALEQARVGRHFILDKMTEVIGEAKPELSKYAPRITTIKIDPEKIGTIIGKGGETIRALCEKYEAQIDVDEEGNVLVYAEDGEKGDACVEEIGLMTKEIEVGDEFSGKIVKIADFGVFIELIRGTDGLLHVSNLVPGKRVDKIDDHVSVGEELNVRVVEADPGRGRFGLRRTNDPEIEGKSAADLAKLGTGNSRPKRGSDSRDGRGDRDKGRGSSRRSSR